MVKNDQNITRIGNFNGMIHTPNEWIHLSVAQVLEMHAPAIRHDGGVPGWREDALL
jgi:hypothetical protein